MKIGQKVYIPKIKQYGTVHEVEDGLVTKVKLARLTRKVEVSGVGIPIEVIMEVGNMVVIAIGLIQKIILRIGEIRYEMREKKLKRKLKK